MRGLLRDWLAAPSTRLGTAADLPRCQLGGKPVSPRLMPTALGRSRRRRSGGGRAAAGSIIATTGLPPDLDLA